MGTTFRAAVLALLAATPSPAAAVERTLILSEEPAVVEMRTAALIMSGQQGGVLPIAIAAVPDGKPCGDSAGGCRFTAVVEIDGAALLEGSPEGPLPVEVFAYVLGTALDVLDQQSLALDLGRTEHRALLAHTGLKVFLPLEVIPGEHQLRILAHAGEAFGLRGLDLAAGAPVAGTPGPRIRTPVFHELAGPWLLAAPAGVEMPLPPPFGLEADLPLPAARPQMPASGSIAGQVFIDGRPGGDLIALVRRSGSEPIEADLVATDRIVDDGFESIAVSFSAPPGVGSGSWEIAVAVADATGEPAAAGARAQSSFVPIFIEPPASATAAAAGVGDHTVTEPKPLAGNQRKLARDVEAGYARALRELARGDAGDARRTLMASEEPVVRALDADAVDVLVQGESRFLEPLPDVEWECLLPVVLLHLDLSRTYRESGQSILAHHATRMTVDLAVAYASKLDTPRARAEAAGALSSLGGYFQHAGVLSKAKRLFTLALDLAEDGSALMGLATLHEKRGLFELAVPVFERLLEAQPGHAEGVLRLALNRARTGRPAAAEKALRRLSSRRENDWITLLAHQELARLRIDKGQGPRAAGVLRRGLERWPGHPTLQLQLAWVLDARGESEASLELLETLGSSTHSAIERSRYNRWPEGLLAAGRRTLAETARSRLPALERWLSSQDGDG